MTHPQDKGNEGLIAEIDIEIRRLESGRNVRDCTDILRRTLNALKAQGWQTVGMAKVPGRYIVCADCDDGKEVCEMEFNGKHWIHEGEPTFCHSYYLEPKLFQPLPQPPQEKP